MANEAFRAEVVRLYQTTLGRDPDAGGLEFFTNLMESGRSVEQVRAVLISTPSAKAEIKKNLEGLYQNHLGRGPDAGGLAYWTNAVLNGQTLQQVRDFMIASPEGVQHIAVQNSPDSRPGRMMDIPGEAPVTRLPGTPEHTSDELDELNNQGDAPTTPQTPQTPGDDPDTRQSALNAAQELEATYPWLKDMGLTSDIVSWYIDDLGPNTIVERIRATGTWQQMFQNIRRPDGTLRMDEGAYLRTMDSYRSVLQNYGQWDERYDTNAELAGFIESEIDPNELEERLQIYDQVTRNDDVRDAFYVYAGMRLSTDDLYQAAVDPRYRDSLAQEYNQRATMTSLDYDTWITRATEVGLDRLANQLNGLEQSGANASEALDQLRSMDPEVAKQFMTVLHIGTQQGGEPLALNALQTAFERALLGSAAAAQGLGLPGVERIEEMRAAGITQAAAMQQYGTYQKDKALLRSMSMRAGFDDFSQGEFEETVFLRQGDALREFEQMTNKEDSYGKASSAGVFGSNAGKLMQQGVRVR